MIYSKYKYIAKVAECRNITRAAQELFISQPSLTRIIATLEKELGVKLFDRSVVPLKLTYAGERYLSECQRILLMDQHLRKEMQEISKNVYGNLSLGCAYSASALWIPHILPLFNKKYPGINIDIVDRTNSGFINELSKGIITLAFCALPLDNQDLNYEYLSSAHIVVYIPQNHPILRGRDLTDNSIENPLVINPEELKAQTFIALNSYAGISKVTSHLMDILNLRPSQVIYMPNTASAYRLAAAGMGILFSTPYATRYTIPGMVPIIATLEDYSISVHNVIAYYSGHTLSAPERDFIDISKKQIQNNPNLLPVNAVQWKKLKESEPETWIFPFS